MSFTRRALAGLPILPAAVTAAELPQQDAAQPLSLEDEVPAFEPERTPILSLRPWVRVAGARFDWGLEDDGAAVRRYNVCQLDDAFYRVRDAAGRLAAIRKVKWQIETTILSDQLMYESDDGAVRRTASMRAFGTCDPADIVVVFRRSFSEMPVIDGYMGLGAESARSRGTAPATPTWRAPRTSPPPESPTQRMEG